MLWDIRMAFRDLDKATMKTIIKMVTTPKLEHAEVVWSLHKKT